MEIKKIINRNFFGIFLQAQWMPFHRTFFIKRLKNFIMANIIDHRSIKCLLTKKLSIFYPLYIFWDFFLYQRQIYLAYP